MVNPIPMLKDIVKDPVELASITFPSAALVVGLFVYRERIHPELARLPDPLTGNPYGVLLFLVVTLGFSLVVKAISHDVLNFTYDIFFRNSKRAKENSQYCLAKSSGLFTSDPLLTKYDKAFNKLKARQHTAVPIIELLRMQSKLARSMALIFLLFGVFTGVGTNWLMALICLLFAFYMWYTFCKFRWDASEKVYEALMEERIEPN